MKGGLGQEPEAAPWTNDGNKEDLMIHVAEAFQILYAGRALLRLLCPDYRRAGFQPATFPLKGDALSDLSYRQMLLLSASPRILVAGTGLAPATSWV